MAFNRKVLFEDGKVRCYHIATCIQHRTESGTIAYIDSYDDEADTGNPAKSPRTSAIACELDVGMTFADAEGIAKTLPQFAEYVEPAQAALDEVLAILTDDQAEQVPDAFPLWAADTAYGVGVRVRYDGKLYKCLQAHTSQEGWEPPNATSLWARIGEGDIPEWVQPTSANPYMMGDKVRHIGKIWQSLIDNNVWEPGSVGSESLWGEVS